MLAVKNSMTLKNGWHIYTTRQRRKEVGKSSISHYNMNKQIAEKATAYLAGDQ
jgi:hypothetical protein